MSANIPWRFHGVWDDGRRLWTYVYRTPQQVRLTGTDDVPVPLDVTAVAAPTVESRPDLYWGWLDVERDVPTMVFPHRALLDICFPCGVDRAVDLGRGQILRLAIARADDETPGR